MKKLFLVICLGCWIPSLQAIGQTKNPPPLPKALAKLDLPVNDSNYYKTFEKFLVARAYVSSKYTSLVLTGLPGIPALNYKPNLPLDVGIGATYNFFTLDIAAGLGFLNGNAAQVNTNYLDLSSHAYTRKVAIDLYGEFYQGFYLPARILSDSNGKNYIRPDIKVDLLGVAGYYILNFRQFSYRAAMVQDEWQQKSAGSFLVGAEIYYGALHGDSALVPSQVKGFPNQHVRTVHFFDIGPGIGYAYTLVWHKNFFITGGLNFNPSVDFGEEFGATDASRLEAVANYNYRAVAGYNSDTWGVNLSWINNQVSDDGVYAGEGYRVKTGYYRLTFDHRFNLRGKLKTKITTVTNTVNNIVPTIH